MLSIKRSTTISQYATRCKSSERRFYNTRKNIVRVSEHLDEIFDICEKIRSGFIDKKVRTLRQKNEVVWMDH